MGHSPWHDLLHLSAAAVLAGGGGLTVMLAFLQRRLQATTGRPLPVAEPVASAGTSLGVVLAAVSLAAGAIHLAAAPAHVADVGVLGWGFVGLAAFQAAWALAWGLSPTRGIALLGIVANLGVVGAWIWSRAVGLPAGALTGTPEPVGVPDAVATLLELTLVALLAARVAGLGATVAARLPDARTIAAIAVVPVVGVVFLATALAVSVALGHDHALDAHGGPAGAILHVER